MRRSVYDGPKEERVGELAVAPQVLVQRDGPTDERTGDADAVAEDCRGCALRLSKSSNARSIEVWRTGEDDEEAIHAEAKAGAARDPDAVPERVEPGEPCVVRLLDPPVDKDEEVADVKAVRGTVSMRGQPEAHVGGEVRGREEKKSGARTRGSTAGGGL